MRQKLPIDAHPGRYLPSAKFPLRGHEDPVNAAAFSARHGFPYLASRLNFLVTLNPCTRHRHRFTTLYSLLNEGQ